MTRAARAVTHAWPSLLAAPLAWILADHPRPPAYHPPPPGQAYIYDGPTNHCLMVGPRNLRIVPRRDCFRG